MGCPWHRPYASKSTLSKPQRPSQRPLSRLPDQFVPPQPAAAVAEPPEELAGTLSERIKASVTVLEFVSQYVELKPTASGAVGLCPFHDDHHPSFGVNAEGNYWHCFAGCGGGSVIDFYIKWRKCDFTTAVRELAEMVL